MAELLICPVSEKPCVRGCDPADGPCERAVEISLHLSHGPREVPIRFGKPLPP